MKILSLVATALLVFGGTAIGATPQTQPATMPSKVGETWTNTLAMTFAYIPACPEGFSMGSRLRELGRDDDETEHEVRLSKPILLGVCEITRGQFGHFVKISRYQTDADKEGWSYAWTGSQWDQVNKTSWRIPGFDQGEDHPVVCVSWNDAVAFCNWLSKKEGRHYRLPTEAEWEFACRARTAEAYPWGENPDAGKGWANCMDLSAQEWFAEWKGFNWRDGFVFTAPVGTFRANAFGLYDMIGNAWEWCSDVYGPYPAGRVTDPTGPGWSEDRVMRGGSWDLGSRYCRSANRAWVPASHGYGRVGFRVAMDLQ